MPGVWNAVAAGLPKPHLPTLYQQGKRPHGRGRTTMSHVTVSLPEWMKRKLEDFGAIDDRSQSWVVRRALKEAFERWEAEWREKHGRAA